MVWQERKIKTMSSFWSSPLKTLLSLRFYSLTLLPKRLKYFKRENNIQCNPDIKELFWEQVSYIRVYLISGFHIFCLGNTGSNLGPEKISLISGFHCIFIKERKIDYIFNFPHLNNLSTTYCLSESYSIQLWRKS